MIEITCPNCKKQIELDENKLDYHKHGRQCKCPKCKKRILFTTPARGYKQDANGSLTRKYKPKKR